MKSTKLDKEKVTKRFTTDKRKERLDLPPSK